MIQEKCTCPNYCKNKHHLISCPIYSTLETQLAHEMVIVTKIYQTNLQKQVTKMIGLLVNGYPKDLSDGIIAEIEKISSEESKHLFQKKDFRRVQNEHKRLCDEIIDEIKAKRINEINNYSLSDKAYNSGLETAISLIESIKNKI